MKKLLGFGIALCLVAIISVGCSTHLSDKDQAMVDEVVGIIIDEVKDCVKECIDETEIKDCVKECIDQG